jgi:hypothetical protein
MGRNNRLKKTRRRGFVRGAFFISPSRNKEQHPVLIWIAGKSQNQPGGTK